MTDAKRERVNLRVAESDRALFERASSLQEESLTRFLIESGRERAERLLADRTNFVVSSEDWKTFAATLDRPAERRPEIAELFRRPRPE